MYVWYGYEQLTCSYSKYFQLVSISLCSVVLSHTSSSSSKTNIASLFSPSHCAVKKTRPQGARVIPEAADGHGCNHKGLLDLKILPSDYLRNYMKVRGWLWNVPCTDCAKGRQGSHNKGDKLDLSSRMPKKGKRDVGYYCNCGPVGQEMEDDHPDKAMYTCDLVLCMGCYERRKESMGRTSRRQKWTRYFKIVCTNW
jgi:hypothetical protein